ncbi:MFS transporter [Paeniglutamicibacter psychrophenolicus]|uniref:MFS transporter n=1 Tax=Paeniglutamicibacter psychrophenolicus TaxID=257454 RepID=UPI0027811246|nr:MFS transporter [Paeniglutamicibacter psychrophenolicus]MDQ0095719.1 MFS family permease [Paeniglutamicibacter psychrophenolicus]
MDKDTAAGSDLDAAVPNRLLRNRPGFQALLFSVAFGALSTGILNVANDLVAIYALGANATQIGILNASESVAFLFLAIPAGIMLDRVNRIGTMMWAQLAAGLAIFSVPLAWSMGALGYLQLVCVSFLVGVAGMLWNMGAGSALPSTVGRDLVSTAYARKETVETSVGIASPGLAGVLVAVMSAPFTLLVAGTANLLAAATLLWGFRRKPGRSVPSAESTPRIGFRDSFGEGLRFTLTNPVIRALVTSSAITNMGLAFGSALETLYFVKVLGFTPPAIGLVISTIAVGGLLGSLLVPSLVGKWGEYRVLALSIFLLPLAVALVPLAALAGTGAVWVVIGHSVLYNALMVSYNATAYGLLAGSTPDGMMGRQQGFRLVFTMGPVPILGIVGGLVGDALGLQNAMWIWVGLTAFAALPLLALLRGKTREEA